jgi:hypothetical protein
MKIDSVQTSGYELLLVGGFNDELRGDITIESFVSFDKPTFSDTRAYASTEYILDSATLEFQYGTYYIGDTTAYNEFEIYMLESPLELPEEGAFYNVSDDVSSESEALISKRFIPHPNLGQDLVVRLSDDLGNDLLTKLSTDADEVSTSTLFQEYFPGFRIAPTEDNDAIFSYSVGDSSSVIKLYYHYSEDNFVEEELFITPVSSTSFYKVNHDYSETPVADLTEGDDGLSSTLSDNMSYLMGLAGFYVKIDFPYLTDIAKLGTAGIVQSATLEIHPATGTYDEEADLPESLSLYIADKFGSTVDAVTYTYGTSLQTGSLNYDEFGDTYYTYTITDFIDEQIFALGLDKQILQLTLADDEMNTTFENLLIGDSNEEIILTISYNLYE